MTTSREEKGQIIERVTFPPPPVDPIGLLPHRDGIARQRVDKARVRRALFNHSQKKTLESDRLNFSTLMLL